MNTKPKYEIGEEVKLQITLEVTATVAGYEPNADENTYLYELKHFGYYPSNSDIFLSDEAEDFELFDGEASIFREEELIAFPMYEAGEQVSIEVETRTTGDALTPSSTAFNIVPNTSRRDITTTLTILR